MGNEVKITGLEEIALQVEKGLRKQMWLTTKQIAKELTNVLKQNLSDFYMYAPSSQYYERSGEFARSIYVQPTQGHGKYGLSIRFDQNELTVDLAPLNSKGKRSGKFNKHASYKGEPIDIDMLVSIEEDRKSFLELVADWTDDFLEKQGYEYHMSITNYDEFEYEAFQSASGLTIL